MLDSIHALTGMAGLLGLAWLASENRRAVPWRAVATGMALLVILAVVFLKVPLVKDAFMKLNDLLLVLERATQAGTSLVFGYLGGGATPFQISNENANFVLAFRALPIVLVISALSALLFYWGVLPALVRAISYLLEKVMRVGGVVGLSAAANVFVGMVEAPLFVRPYLMRISRGELFAIMAGGMASIAGTVLFLYGFILSRTQPDAVAHLLIASILSAPAALVVAFLMVPPETTRGEALALKSDATGSMDALTRGTLDGAQLLINIIAMLVVFSALVALVNLMIAPYTLQGALGWVLAPLAWLSGVSWGEARAAGSLLGTKTVINELVAYIDLANMKELSERTRLLLTYALCGFANFGSLGIMIGGLGTMAPERRSEVVDLGIRSIVAGMLATCLTAATVALIL
ncbi:MAG TPA: nucleoside transporter C-terminal domain-containing protein [Burkholderiales bacterium]|nr:nucleoside transporter C-terminal domain-containing protein [Burkholderiales bacterium]